MLYETLISLINTAGVANINCICNLDPIEYLKEFRTINCNVPRQTGKTTALTKLHRNTSSLLFNRHRVDGNSNSIESFQYEEIFRGRNLQGLKYSFILLDEYPEIPDRLHKIIQFLQVSRAVTDDLMIVGLHTK